MTTVVVIGILLIAAVLVIDTVARNVGASNAVARNECVLVTAVVLPDVGAGRCPEGETCVATRRRAYLRFWEQDAECGCKPPQ